MSHFQCSSFCSGEIQGYRASLRSPLATRPLATLFRAPAALATVGAFTSHIQLHFKLNLPIPRSSACLNGGG